MKLNLTIALLTVSAIFMIIYYIDNKNYYHHQYHNGNKISNSNNNNNHKKTTTTNHYNDDDKSSGSSLLKKDIDMIEKQQQKNNFDKNNNDDVDNIDFLLQKPFLLPTTTTMTMGGKTTTTTTTTKFPTITSLRGGRGGLGRGGLGGGGLGGIISKGGNKGSNTLSTKAYLGNGGSSEEMMNMNSITEYDTNQIVYERMIEKEQFKDHPLFDQVYDLEVYHDINIDNNINENNININNNNEEHSNNNEKNDIKDFLDINNINNNQNKIMELAEESSDGKPIIISASSSLPVSEQEQKQKIEEKGNEQQQQQPTIIDNNENNLYYKEHTFTKEELLDYAKNTQKEKKSFLSRLIPSKLSSSNNNNNIITIYLKKEDCPYSTRLAIFLGETGLYSTQKNTNIKIQYDTSENRQMLLDLTGKQQFPAILLEANININDDNNDNNNNNNNDMKKVVKKIGYEASDIIDFFLIKYKVSDEYLTKNLPAYQLYTQKPDGLETEYIKITSRLNKEFHFDVHEFSKNILEENKIKKQKQLEDKTTGGENEKPKYISKAANNDNDGNNNKPKEVNFRFSKSKIDIYLQRKNCPSSVALLSFLSEAKLLDQVTIHYDTDDTTMNYLETNFPDVYPSSSSSSSSSSATKQQPQSLISKENKEYVALPSMEITDDKNNIHVIVSDLDTIVNFYREAYDIPVEKTIGYQMIRDGLGQTFKKFEHKLDALEMEKEVETAKNKIINVP